MQIVPPQSVCKSSALAGYLLVLCLAAILTSCSTSSGSPGPSVYSIGGTVSGLAGTGLVLQDNGGNNLSISTNGTFTFAGTLNSGTAYSVTILTQPSNPVQTCVVTSGSGTATSNVTSVQVTCPPVYTIGGTISGLTGAGLVLQDNGGDNLSTLSNGSFTFPTPLQTGTAYTATVLTQPSNPQQNCVVSNASGTANANVTNIQVVCTTVTYTISGTVSNMNGGGLVLQDNGTDNLTINANGPFTFATPIAGDFSFDVTVLTQPANGQQTCVVTNGNAVVTSNVTNVAVNCSATFAHGNWTWMAGPQPQDWPGQYGTIGVAGPNNYPGTRWAPSAGEDPSGDFWLFGGEGVDSAQATGQLNDLWEFKDREWAWIAGPDTCCSAGSYGTMGVAATSNLPPARQQAVSWTDKSGNLWLFGGAGVNIESTQPLYNDLWEFNISTQLWTWVGGTNTYNQPGVYGTKGVASSSNVPAPRMDAVSWTDNAGNFWLFGGSGYDVNAAYGNLNDLWKYSNGEWTWVSGANVVGQYGVYGTQGVGAAGNTPGARYQAMGWTDASGNLWLFGGGGLAQVAGGDLNDLWEYKAGEWLWVAGSNTPNVVGVYGTQGVANSTNFPGGRQQGLTWVDPSGNFWLFGGGGLDSAGALGPLNDLWKYSGGEWTWVNGSDTVNPPMNFGTLGVAASTNTPWGRYGSVGWVDSTGKLWMFGGFNSTNESKCGCLPTLGDLWVYEP